MTNSVLHSILVEIQSAGFFSILADEATDVNRCEQMCVWIRLVNDEYEVSEDHIGLMQVPQTDSSTLFGALRDVYIHCMLPFEKCRGQAYDGAAKCQDISMVLLHVLNVSKVLPFMCIV